MTKPKPFDFINVQQIQCLVLPYHTNSPHQLIAAFIYESKIFMQLIEYQIDRWIFCEFSHALQVSELSDQFIKQLRKKIQQTKTCIEHIRAENNFWQKAKVSAEHSTHAQILIRCAEKELIQLEQFSSCLSTHEYQ